MLEAVILYGGILRRYFIVGFFCIFSNFTQQSDIFNLSICQCLFYPFSHVILLLSLLSFLPNIWRFSMIISFLLCFIVFMVWLLCLILSNSISCLILSQLHPLSYSPPTHQSPSTPPPPSHISNTFPKPPTSSSHITPSTSPQPLSHEYLETPLQTPQTRPHHHLQSDSKYD